MHLRKAAEDVSVLKMRCSINADTMTKAELHQKLKTGYRDIGKGRVRNASKAFEEWQRKCETSERMKICRLRFKYRKLFYLMSSIR